MLHSLSQGDRLRAGDTLVSPNGKFKFFFGSNGDFTLYRFEPGRLIPLARFSIDPARGGFIHISQTGAAQLAGHFCGSWTGPLGGIRWARPGHGGPVNNPLATLNDDGNFVLYSRTDGGTINGARWSTETSGNYEATINPDEVVGLIAVGRISIDANAVLTNSLPSSIQVSDGRIAKELPPNASVGIYAPGGPGQVAIDFNSFDYDLETGRIRGSNAAPFRTQVNGSVVRIIQGARESAVSPIHCQPTNFSHVLLPHELHPTQDIVAERPHDLEPNGDGEANNAVNRSGEVDRIQN